MPARYAALITQGTGSNAMNFAYAYDSRGNITSETRNGKVTTYTYDGKVKLKTKTDSDGYVTTYGYYGLDMVTSINYNDGRRSLINTTKWAFWSR